MRIWDVPPAILCRQHLLGEHRELHALWTILTAGKMGYVHHPETLRWKGKLAALYGRHEELVEEMHRRGYRHASPLDPVLATGVAYQIDYVDPIERQYRMLEQKGCGCSVTQAASRRPDDKYHSATYDIRLMEKSYDQRD
jgi:pyrimidine dimer DNA glycosylase